MAFRVFHVQKWNALPAWTHKLALRLNAGGEGFWGEVIVCLCRTHGNLIYLVVN